MSTTTPSAIPQRRLDPNITYAWRFGRFFRFCIVYDSLHGTFIPAVDLVVGKICDGLDWGLSRLSPDRGTGLAYSGIQVLML